MGPMLARESVQSRLHSDDGMTFTEFTYQIFQGYDFYHLHKKENVCIQLGGGDQWGNIASGLDYIRKKEGENHCLGATVKLLTTNKGEKLGKSCGNGLWMSADMCSPFEFYQFFLNTPDDCVEKLLNFLTFAPDYSIQEVLMEHNIDPEQRVAQKFLAETLTKMVHGSTVTEVLETTKALFSKETENVAEWSLERFLNHFSNVQSNRANLEHVPISKLLSQYSKGTSRKEF